MASDTDELREALEKTRAELAAVAGRAQALNDELDASPELVLSAEQLESELQTAREREAQLIEAVKRARGERTPALAQPRQEGALAPPPDLAALVPPSAGVRRPRPARMGRVFLALGLTATGLAASLLRDPTIAVAGSIGMLVLALVLRSRE